MMMSEFVERTKYQPEMGEYRFIEESYYEFDGGKDAFCKQWCKDKKSGKWAQELRFRKALEEQEAKYESRIAELKASETTLAGICKMYCEEIRELEDRAGEAERKLAAIEKALSGNLDER